MGEFNDGLWNATIHFLAEPCFNISQDPIKAEITNTSEDNKSAMVIIAEYENNILKDIVSSTVTFAAGEKKTYNFNGNGKYKVFIWDSLKGMRPLNK